MRLEKGYKYLETDRADKALEEFKFVFEKSSDQSLVLESAKKLAEIYFRQKDYKTSIRYLDVLIANSDSFLTSMEALRKKASIQHKNLSLFEDAIATYSRILSYSDLKESEQIEARLNLAKCYFSINQLEQARQELKPLLAGKYSREMVIEAQKLQASIYQAESNFKEAIQTYKNILQVVDDEQQKRETLLNMSLCYEQNEDYKEALEALKQIEPKDELLEGKIKQLTRMSVFQGRRLRK